MIKNCVQEYIDAVKNYSYASDYINDVLFKLGSEVCKIVSNCECGMYSAVDFLLKEELDEFYGKGIFIIKEADGEL